MIEDYEKKQSKIIEVKSFIDSKAPSDTYIDIEFENGDLGIFHVKKNDHTTAIEI